MFLALAADVNLDEFTWLVFKRKTTMRTSPQAFNQRHTLVLSEGDVFGVLRTRKNVYQLVKADALHVLYRGISESLHNNIFKNCIPYKGVTPSLVVETGFVRAKRKETGTVEKKTFKRTDDYFKPIDPVVEKSQLDYEQYQWRKMLKRIRLVSKKTEKTQTILAIGQLVGLRYNTPARGSYIIYDNDNRVHVSHEMFTEVLHNSRCLPISQQREGIVDIDTGIVLPSKKQKAATKKIQERSTIKRRDPRAERIAPPPVVEETIVPKYDLTEITDEDIVNNKRVRGNTARRVQNVVNNIMTKIPDLEEWNENIEEEEDEELPEDQDEGGVDPDIDGEESEEDDDDTEVDLDEEEVAEDHELADVLVPGTQFKVGKREFVVLQADIMERNENLMEYFLYEIDNDDSDFMLYKLRLPSNYMLSDFEERADISEDEYAEKDLQKLQDKIEYATFKTLPLVK